MEIVKFKKISKGRYKVILDNNELVLYEDVILKYNLLVNKKISLECLNNIIKDNNYYEAYNLVLSYIEIKLRTRKEIEDYLCKKDYDNEVIDKVITSLKDIDLLNEYKYVEAYTNDKINLSNMGPYKIKFNLIGLGIDESIIDSYLINICDDIWIDKINKIVEKKQKINKKSLYIFKNKLKFDLFNLGYPNEMIDSFLNNNLSNDELNIIKEYDKAYNKYKNKYKDEALNLAIKNYLYKKGYRLEDINNLFTY